jgi:hypothetical protein
MHDFVCSCPRFVETNQLLVEQLQLGNTTKSSQNQHWEWVDVAVAFSLRKLQCSPEFTDKRRGTQNSPALIKPAKTRAGGPRARPQRIPPQQQKNCEESCANTIKIKIKWSGITHYQFGRHGPRIAARSPAHERQPLLGGRLTRP